MFTSLDFLVVVFMVLIAVTLLTLCLMFIFKNNTARRICFYAATVPGLYLAWVGFRIGFGGGFQLQMATGILTALIIGSIAVFEIFRKNNTKMFLITRISLVCATMAGLFNAIL